mgnify:CR=1 FL=1
MRRMAIEPSPTAAATRLIEPLLASPTAKTGTSARPGVGCAVGCGVGDGGASLGVGEGLRVGTGCAVGTGSMVDVCLAAMPLQRAKSGLYSCALPDSYRTAGKEPRCVC